MPDFTQPASFLETAVFFFAGIFGRYVLLCVLFQYLFKVRYKTLFAQSEVNVKPRYRQQHWREIGYSLLTSLIFSLVAAGMMMAWQKRFWCLPTGLSAAVVTGNRTSLSVALISF